LNPRPTDRKPKCLTRCTTAPPLSDLINNINALLEGFIVLATKVPRRNYITDLTCKSSFTDWMLFLTPNQQCLIEGN